MRINRNLLGLHTAVILLGMTGLFGKFLDIHPTAIIAGRSFFTAISVYLLLKFLRVKVAIPINREFGLLFLSGVLLAGHWFAFFHSIQLSTVAIGVLGFSTYPVFVTLLEPLFFREALRSRDIFSACLVFIGLMIISPSIDISNAQTLALAWAIFSGFILSVFTLLNRQIVKQHHFLVITFYQHTAATLCILPLVWVVSSWPSANEVLGLMLLGVLFTAVPQSLLVRSLKKVKAQLVSVVVGLEPLYAIVFAAILLNEIPETSTILGGGIILVAVGFAMKSHAPK